MFGESERDTYQEDERGKRERGEGEREREIMKGAINPMNFSHMNFFHSEWVGIRTTHISGHQVFSFPVSSHYVVSCVVFFKREKSKRGRKREKKKERRRKSQENVHHRKTSMTQHSLTRAIRWLFLIKIREREDRWSLNVIKGVNEILKCKKRWEEEKRKMKKNERKREERQMKCVVGKCGKVWKRGIKYEFSLPGKTNSFWGKLIHSLKWKPPTN